MGVLAATIAALQAAATCPYDTSVPQQAVARNDIATALNSAQSIDRAVAPAYPAWRSPSWSKDQWQAIPGTDNLIALLGDAQWAANFDASSGMKCDKAGNVNCAATGGHATVVYGGHRSTFAQCTLGSGAPAWVLLDGPSPRSAWYDASNNIIPPGGPRSADGRYPVTRHTYYTTQAIYPEHAHDGVERILLVGCSAAVFDGFNYTDSNGVQHSMYTNGNQCEAFQLGPKVWDVPGTYADLPGPTGDIDDAVARDPRDGSIYSVSGSGVIYKLSPLTRAHAQVPATPVYPAHGRMPDMTRLPLAFDHKRGRLASVVLTGYTDLPKSALVTVDLNVSPAQVTFAAITGPLTLTGAQGRGLVYDGDNDRWLYFDFKPGTSPTFTLYAIDPVTAVATSLGVYPTPPTAGGVGYSVDGRVDWHPLLGGVVYMPHANGKMQFLPTR